MFWIEPDPRFLWIFSKNHQAKKPICKKTFGLKANPPKMYFCCILISSCISLVWGMCRQQAAPLALASHSSEGATLKTLQNLYIWRHRPRCHRNHHHHCDHLRAYLREGFKNPSHGIRPLGGYPPHPPTPCLKDRKT